MAKLDEYGFDLKNPKVDGSGFRPVLLVGHDVESKLAMEIRLELQNHRLQYVNAKLLA